MLSILTTHVIQAYFRSTLVKFKSQLWDTLEKGAQVVQLQGA